MRVFATCILILVATARVVSGQYVPPHAPAEWATLTPEQAGWNEEALPALRNYLSDTDTDAFLILKGGRIAFEEYFDGFTADDLGIWYSAGKGLAAVLVGLAAEEGLLDLDIPSSVYLGRWSLMTREQEDSVRVRHHLSMTTGLDESGSFACTLRLCLTYRAPAGQRWVYHNAPYNLVRQAIEAVSGQSIADFSNSRLGPSIGFSGTWTQVGFNSFHHSTARSAARLGLLVSRGGLWGSERVLGHDYVEAMTSPSQDLNPSYGYLWWLNGGASHIAPESPESIVGPIAPSGPEDAVAAAGNNGQFIAFSPSLDIVWVRLGKDPGGGLVPIGYYDALWARIADLTRPVGSAIEGSAESLSPRLQVAPNPATGFLFVSGQARDRVQIYDMLGRSHGPPISLQAEWTSIHIGALSAGVYLLTSAREGMARPFVVER